MTPRTRTHLAIGSSLALAFALALGFPVEARAGHGAQGMKMMDDKAMDHCRDMKAQKRKMNDDMKAQDAALTDLVARMNRGPGEKQMDLMAAVITQMAEQRVAMNARHAKMDDEMMEHMMKHMAMGKDSMSQCPMMKGMKGMDDASMGAHAEHHDKEN